MSNSRSYWFGDVNREALQRVYGVSFPSQKLLKEHLDRLEKAKKSNHMLVGKNQSLYHFSSEYSPGSCFFESKGASIYHKMQEFLRAEYRKRGYKEVISPNIYKTNLWQKSGHWQHYACNMFRIPKERVETCADEAHAQKGEGINHDSDYALKPMNCPGHCLMFAQQHRSYKELPMRLCEFGVVHRKEASGALTGLTRVVRFCQDDGHIFCAPDQVEMEIDGCIDLMSHIYSTHCLTFSCELSTRPDKYIGEIDLWNKTEKQLEASLNKRFPGKWTLNPGDGAFYGPKIDIKVHDSLGRSHQLATFQLDVNLPERFDLSFNGEDNKETRPVIIHRAIYGSFERAIGILAEHYGGRWPLWLSPAQICFIPINLEHEKFVDKLISVYNEETDHTLHIEKYHADCAMNGRVRKAQVQQFNFICVVGDSDVQDGCVNVRTRENVVHGKVKIDDFLKIVQKMVKLKTPDSNKSFPDIHEDIKNSKNLQNGHQSITERINSV